ncbi:hypothetical protein N7466_004360 [Penicillium verhagenii]|uniref:uncharacterized protein n=1 Tax=Penicillium verhagenii TaxID=1562060 RepID=UPI0025456625|nr:uncharacterized protein N7466_004360 [Penicillium verhagenii]KAJ5934813.1 hypothetical protein N7466_004360 [Penicillium verhagenii]
MSSFQQNFGRRHLSPDTARSLGLNEYGNPRLDDFSTPFACALLDEVPVRDVKWRSTEKMKVRTYANKLAALAYQVGIEVGSPCDCCQKLTGPFATCVVVITKSNKLLWEGACASCAYLSRMKSCSFRTYGALPREILARLSRIQSDDPRLEDYEGASEADSEAASASAESSSYDWTPGSPGPSSEVAARLESNNQFPRRTTMEIDVALSPAGPAHLEVSATETPVSSEAARIKVSSSSNASPNLTSGNAYFVAIADDLGTSSNNPLPFLSPRPTTDNSMTTPFQPIFASSSRTVRTSAGPDYPDTWYKSPLDDHKVYTAANRGDIKPLMEAYKAMSVIEERLKYDRRRIERTLIQKGALVERDIRELEERNPWAEDDDEPRNSRFEERFPDRHKRRRYF